ncbi:dermokine-like isoform X1 [Microtus oregoni]|uniref:dermokine-like isoform X1 n=1 Tax=Microtus oregoni TaxID=111838 RepID=UPI001BB25BBA|nr:dermokine-like isoform X1 [Microtus oregoni]
MKSGTFSALLLILLGVAWCGDSHSWGPDLPSLQKRAGGAEQPEAARQELSAVTSKNYYNNPQGNPTYNWQYYTKATTAKGAVTPSSSASRAQPGLLKWLKFW